MEVQCLMFALWDFGFVWSCLFLISFHPSLLDCELEAYSLFVACFNVIGIHH